MRINGDFYKSNKYILEYTKPLFYANINNYYSVKLSDKHEM